MASIILFTKSAKVIEYTKVYHLDCFSGFDLAKFYASALINILEIGIFGRPVIIESEEFNLFSNPDLIDDDEKLFEK